MNGNQVTLDLNGQNYRSSGGDNDRDDNQSYNVNYNGPYNAGYYGNVGQRQITINDQPALDNRASGRVAVGRYVTASGYWQNGVF